ncbi:MAG: 23S rRNA (guanosine(2251)-2'-O)-methyltransferase RlmB [Thiomargarita sp.]|nr:23S rRNA (guanosine(2251)-2'-O)-methyltransferase RlmB [Thiomargarita sp.]
MTQYEQIFGLHAVRHVFHNDFSRIVELWTQREQQSTKIQALQKQAEELGITIQSVPRKTLDKLTENGHHQGVVIKARPVKNQLSLEALFASSNEAPFLLVLDDIQDPHNLGACLRSADAAGIHAVIIPKNKSCPLTPTVRQVASGADIPIIQVTNLARTLQWLKEQGIWLIGADSETQTSLFESKLTGSLAVVLGAEGKGLRRLTREMCDSLVRIPMLGKVESLNVSVATGICLYEAVRQRQSKVKKKLSST